MGVNYASVITWPTNDELRERQRMIQIRKNELRRKLSLPLAPVAAHPGTMQTSGRVTSKDAVCEAWRMSVEAEPDMTDAQRVVDIAVQFGVSIDTVYQATAGTLRKSQPRGPLAKTIHMKAAVMAEYRIMTQAEPKRLPCEIRHFLAAKHGIGERLVRRWVYGC
jgi:hypothetical protein